MKALLRDICDVKQCGEWVQTCLVASTRMTVKEPNHDNRVATGNQWSERDIVLYKDCGGTNQGESAEEAALAIRARCCSEGSRKLDI